MKEVLVRLPSVETVQRFVAALTPLQGDFELLSERITLDARSLMGIFGFDLSKPIRLKIYHATEQNLVAIQPFLAETEEKKNEQ